MAHKVLLADDSVTAQNMGRRILVDAGYEVITVNNGSSALKKITEAKPDLIVLDVYMPGYGGLEVCQRIRETPETARIPVLLTVGKLEPFKGDEARRVRADAFIVKPFEASELLAALTHLEDKIVAQPSAPKRGQLKTGPAPESGSDFGDKDRGWRSRLRIPPLRGKDHETEAGPPPSQEFYEVKLRGSESAPAPTETAAVAPPVVEQEALNRIPEPEDGQRPETEPAVESKASQPAAGDERTIAKDLEATPARPEIETAVHPESAAATSVAPVAEDRPQGDQRLGAEEVAAALATLAPENPQAGAPATTEARSQAGTAEAASAVMAATGTGLQVTGSRWIAEPIALTNDESSLILEHEMQKALAAPAADAAPSVVSHSGIPSPATESSTSPETKLTPQPEKAVSAGSTIETRDGTVVSASSSQSAEGKAALLPESSNLQEKPLQAYAAQASAGEGQKPQGTNAEVVASSQPSPATDLPAVAAQSKEDPTLAAVERLLTESLAPPALTAKIVEVTQSSLNKVPETSGTQSATEARAGAPAESADAIARIVDGVLAELKPKLIEEIVKKMTKDGK